MIGLVTVLAAFVAWLGVSLIVLADGRLGLTAGVALATAGLAGMAWPSGGAAGVVAVATGGAIAAGLRLRTGPPGWNVMPAGSTHRLVLCMASGLVGLWVAASVMTGDGAPVRFGVLITIALASARVLVTDDGPAATTAIAVLVLAVAVAEAAWGLTSSPWPLVAAAVVAAGVSWFPRSRLEPR